MMSNVAPVAAYNSVTARRRSGSMIIGAEFGAPYERTVYLPVAADGTVPTKKVKTWLVFGGWFSLN